MDNTAVRQRVVLVKKTFNPFTGERTIRVKPKLVKKRKVIVARGYRSMSYDGSGHTIGDVLTAKAIPFRFAMKTMLNRRGILTLGLPLKTILVKFFNEFSGRKRLDESAFINNVAFKLKTDDTTPEAISIRNRTQYMEVTELVNTVIEIFKLSRDKYLSAEANGMNPEQVLRDEEVTAAKAVFMVERSLLKESKKDHFVSSGELKKTLYWIAGFILVLWLVKKYA